MRGHIGLGSDDRPFTTPLIRTETVRSAVVFSVSYELCVANKSSRAQDMWVLHEVIETKWMTLMNFQWICWKNALGYKGMCCLQNIVLLPAHARLGNHPFSGVEYIHELALSAFVSLQHMHVDYSISFQTHARTYRYHTVPNMRKRASLCE